MGTPPPGASSPGNGERGRYTAPVPRRLPLSLLRETAGLYLLGVATICLLLSIDLLSVLARFLIQQNATLNDVARLLAFKLPWFLHLSLPVAVVFAVLLAGGRMAKDSELKAAYALGVPPNALLLPLVGFGLVVGAVSLANNGFLEARAEAAYQGSIDAFIYARPPTEMQANAAYRLPDGVYFAARVRSVEGRPDVATLDGVLVALDDGGLISARSGTWDATVRTWTLEDAQRAAPGEPARAAGSVTLPFALETTPSETMTRAAELPIDQLWRQLRRITAAGGDAAELRYDLHRRIADAFSAAIFAAFAGAIALRVRGRAAGFAWTMVLLVGFWATWVLSGDLFTSGALGPLQAAWLTPAAAGVGAALLAIRSARA